MQHRDKSFRGAWAALIAAVIGLPLALFAAQSSAQVEEGPVVIEHGDLTPPTPPPHFQVGIGTNTSTLGTIHAAPTAHSAPITETGHRGGGMAIQPVSPTDRLAARLRDLRSGDLASLGIMRKLDQVMQGVGLDQESP